MSRRGYSPSRALYNSCSVICSWVGIASRARSVCDRPHTVLRATNSVRLWNQVQTNIGQESYHVHAIGLASTLGWSPACWEWWPHLHTLSIIAYPFLSKLHLPRETCERSTAIFPWRLEAQHTSRKCRMSSNLIFWYSLRFGGKGSRIWSNSNRPALGTSMSSSRRPFPS